MLLVLQALSQLPLRAREIMFIAADFRLRSLVHIAQTGIRELLHEQFHWNTRVQNYAT